jgi:hypothetical protein
MCAYCQDGIIREATDAEAVTFCENCADGLSQALRELSRKLCGLGNTLADIDAKGRTRGLGEWERRWRAGVQATFDATLERHDLLQKRWDAIAAEEREHVRL